MLDANFFDSLAKQLSNKIPSSLHALDSNIEANVKSALLVAFAKLDLVTREEFDVQTRLLQKAHEKILALEERIRVLEEKIS